MESVLLVKRCAMCSNSAFYDGPEMLKDAAVWCSEVCELLYDLLTPGEWIDASELMRGGRLSERPDLWNEN